MWVLAAATLVNRAGTMVLPFMAIYLTRERGLAPELAAGIIAVYGATSLVAAPLSGRLGDRFGARRLAMGLLAGAGVVMLLFPLAKSLTQLFVMTGVLSLLAEGFRPVSMALLGQLTPPALRKQGFALGRLAVNLGMTIGATIGGLLADRWFTAVFLVDGVTSIAAAAVLLLALEGAGAAPAAKSPTHDGLRAHRDARFVYFLVPVLLSSVVFFQLDAALPLQLVNELGLTPSAFGLMMSINPVLIIFLEVPLNAATEGWPASRALAAGATLVGLGFGAVLFAEGFSTAAASVVVWTFGEMMLFPASAAYVAELAPPGRSGEYMGAYSMTFGAAFAIGPWAGVALMERYGSATLWLTALGVGLVSALMFAMIRAPALQEDHR